MNDKNSPVQPFKASQFVINTQEDFEPIGFSEALSTKIPVFDDPSQQFNGPVHTADKMIALQPK